MTGNNTAKKVALFTGLTGFIGSNICRELIKRGFKIYGLRRSNSSFEKIKDVYKSITWINIQNNAWEDELNGEKIDVLIHSAWEGVSIDLRDNWEIQLKNFDFSRLVYKVAANHGASRIISLGSQAEYGRYSEIVSENLVPMPIDAYGAIKLLTLNYLQSFAQKVNIEWYWIRVFSVFGHDENDNWLVPHVIKKLRKKERIELTGCKQVYDYLHIDDFVNNFIRILISRSDNSGIYNLCSGKGVEIKNLLIQIAGHFPDSQSLLDFDKIPYRDNQNMFIVGNSDKFESVFGKMSKEDFNKSIEKTINYY